MEDHRPSATLNLPAETSQLVKTLLQRQRYPVIQEKERNFPDDPTETIKWVCSKDFTIEIGKTQISEYIGNWELKPSWLHSLDYLCSTKEEHRDFHHYRARFSTPTQQNSIQQTASVYFTVLQSIGGPQSEPVEVHFIVESNRLVHTPGRTRFREKWLTDIIESKTALRRAMDL